MNIKMIRRTDDPLIINWFQNLTLQQSNNKTLLFFTPLFRILIDEFSRISFWNVAVIFNCFECFAFFVHWTFVKIQLNLLNFQTIIYQPEMTGSRFDLAKCKWKSIFEFRVVFSFFPHLSHFFFFWSLYVFPIAVSSSLYLCVCVFF